MPLSALVLESRLFREIAPGEIERFYQILTEADERLLESGRWHWTRGPLDLTPEDGVVVMPEGYNSIVGCRIGSLARGVLWQEIEYLEDGPGTIPIEGVDGQLLDQGLIDGVRTYRCTGSTPGEIVVLARFAPVEITGPADIPRCQNFQAIKQAMLSIVHEGNGDEQRSGLFMAMALAACDRQEAAYRGVAKKIRPAAQFLPLRRRSRTNFP